MYLDEVDKAIQEQRNEFYNKGDGKKQLEEAAKTHTESLGVPAGEGNVTSPGLTPDFLNTVEENRASVQESVAYQDPQTLLQTIAKKSVSEPKQLKKRDRKSEGVATSVKERVKADKKVAKQAAKQLEDPEVGLSTAAKEDAAANANVDRQTEAAEEARVQNTTKPVLPKKTTAKKTSARR